MTQNLINFALEVYSKAEIEYNIDNSYNMIVYISGRTLIIPIQDIEKYYKGYIMSNQTRADAIERATKKVQKTILQWRNFYRI